ncbi:dirigent protein 2 [Phtheirospermum japonicum]|uniref:Dirigent protein n=1 Tax=Phtheirospermum japonicum TaxID=374723 RepID=A0A830DAR0_9LAMI|nr:dirigent protein 2 [Phtheirospermum japonicum]
MASFLTNTTAAALFTLTLIFKATDASFSETKHSQESSAMTHLHFYFHDIVSGKNPTAITVAGRRNKFGGTAIIDDPLTEGAEPGSKVVGKAQGMYAMSSKDLASLLMLINFAFSEGKYNGSSLSILGRNRFLESVREMPVVGGTGVFRFARGYALAKTERYNVGSGDAVVEYNVYVMHH